MQEKDRENIALFRYGLIAPILNGQVDSQKEYLEKVCAQIHQVPYWGPKEYTPKAVKEWLRFYRKHGFEGLKPKPRSDRGKNRSVPCSLQEKVLEERRLREDMPVTLFYEKLVQEGIIKKCDFSYATIHRLLKKHDLVGKQKRKEPERKRFAYETVNILWQTDATSGIYLKEGSKKKPTSLIAFIDDCSRLVPAARFSFTENTEDLMKVFEQALLRRGIPKIVYADNGKIFRSDQFQLACASLGISIAHTPVQDGAAKGKIEKFFGGVKMRFFPLLREKKINNLNELNKFFWQWLEQEYHRRVHSALGMTPLDKYLSQMSQVKMVEDPDTLKLLFLKRKTRKVRHDGTISLNNQLFEVPPAYIGQKVELRFDEELKTVMVFEEGRPVADVKAVNLADNARVKREKRKLSFTKLNREEDSYV